MPVLERNGTEIHYDVYGASDDELHPRPVAHEIAELAPDAELVLAWTSPVRHDETLARIQAFLRPHTAAHA